MTLSSGLALPPLSPLLTAIRLMVPIVQFRRPRATEKVEEDLEDVYHVSVNEIGCYRVVVWLKFRR